MKLNTMLILLNIVLSLILFGCGSEATPSADDEQVIDAPSSPSKASLLLVEINEDLISIQSRDVPLQAILDKITQLTEIEFLIEVRLADTVSLRFVDLPVDEAIRRLLGKRNQLFFYNKEADGGRLQKVLVIAG